MSAANFYSINAAAIFAVTDRGADCSRLLYVINKFTLAENIF